MAAESYSQLRNKRRQLKECLRELDGSSDRGSLHGTREEMYRVDAKMENLKRNFLRRYNLVRMLRKVDSFPDDHIPPRYLTGLRVVLKPMELPVGLAERLISDSNFRRTRLQAFGDLVTKFIGNEMKPSEAEKFSIQKTIDTYMDDDLVLKLLEDEPDIDLITKLRAEDPKVISMINGLLIMDPTTSVDTLLDKIRLPQFYGPWATQNVNYELFQRACSQGATNYGIMLRLATLDPEFPTLGQCLEPVKHLEIIKELESLVLAGADPNANLKIHLEEIRILNLTIASMPGGILQSIYNISHFNYGV
jgi:hypothetical protein